MDVGQTFGADVQMISASPAAGAFEELGGGMDRIVEAVKRLEERLAVVLLPEPTGVEQLVATNAQSAVRSAAQRAWALATAIDSLTARVDL